MRTQVALAIWGPGWPYKCTIKGYRKLSDDFRGNIVYTGYTRTWESGGPAGRRIDTGFISPGVKGEYDIVDCRDKETVRVKQDHDATHATTMSLMISGMGDKKQGRRRMLLTARGGVSLAGWGFVFPLWMLCGNKQKKTTSAAGA
jgi:hypothetical protein